MDVRPHPRPLPRRRVGALVALAAITGCSVAAKDASAVYAGPKNECSTSCVDGECIDSACRASETNYDFVFEVTPPSAAHYAPNVTFLLGDTVSRSKGTRPLALPPVAHVTFKSDPPIALAVRLTRRDWIPGTAGGSYEARGGTDGKVELDVPPHEYDLYVAPANDEDRKIYPPITQEKVPLNTSAQIPIDYRSLDSFKKLTISLTDQDGKALQFVTDTRDVSVVDTSTGDVVSTLARTCDDASTAIVRFGLPITSHTYVLRIASPSVPCKTGDAVPFLPSFDVDLAALTVEGGSGKATVKLPNTPKAISVLGKIQAAGGKTTFVPGSLTFRSTSLDGVSLGRSWSNVSVTAESGTYGAKLFPGKYTVEIVPSVSDPTAQKYALRVHKDVVISTDTTREPLALEVFPRTRVTGSAASLDESLFSVGVVEANSSTTLLSIEPTDEPSPRSASTTIALVKDKATTANPNPPTYNVTLALDTGKYDFIVRVPEASGFPWIVRDAVDVLPAPVFELGTMTVTSPVVISGRVTDPNGDPVARATVRARGLRTSTSGQPIAAVLVAETKADESGNYSLMLPKSFASTAK